MNGSKWLGWNLVCSFKERTMVVCSWPQSIGWNVRGFRSLVEYGRLSHSSVSVRLYISSWINRFPSTCEVAWDLLFNFDGLNDDIGLMERYQLAKLYVQINCEACTGFLEKNLSLYLSFCSDSKKYLSWDFSKIPFLETNLGKTQLSLRIILMKPP